MIKLKRFRQSETIRIQRFPGLLPSDSCTLRSGHMPSWPRTRVDHCLGTLSRLWWRGTSHARFNYPAVIMTVLECRQVGTGSLSASALRRRLLHRSRQLTLCSPCSLGKGKDRHLFWFSGDSHGSRNRGRMSLIARLKSIVVRCLGADAFSLIEFARTSSWPLVLTPPSTLTHQASIQWDR